jgi:hypothetical protein
MVDHFRRSHRLIPTDDLDEEIAAPDFEVASLASIDVDRLLGGLPMKQQAAIRATKIEGLSLAETAAAARISQSDAKSASRAETFVRASTRESPMIALQRSTDQLVQSLVSDLRPVPRAMLARRLALGATAGAFISVVLLVLMVGTRPDLAQAILSLRFWSKGGYMLATAGISLLVVARLARPGSSPDILWLLPIPLVIYLPAAILELVRTEPANWMPLLLGYGWQLCTSLILILSIPIYIGLWWAFRSFAPTRIEVAGAVAGLCASAIAGVVYHLRCPTDTAVFTLTWYTLAFAVASIFGHLFARRLLHW